MRIGKSTYSLMWPDALSSNETRMRRRANDERRRDEGLPVPERMVFIKRDKAKSARFRQALLTGQNDRSLTPSQVPPRTANLNSESQEIPTQPRHDGHVEVHQALPAVEQPEFTSINPALVHEPENAGGIVTPGQTLQSSATTSNTAPENTARSLQKLNDDPFPDWPGELKSGSDLDLLKQNFSLLARHLQFLKAKDSAWLENLQLLINKNAELVASNFNDIKDLDCEGLSDLLNLLTRYEEWTKSNFSTACNMDMKGLLLHLENNLDWTTQNLRKLQNYEDISGLVPWVKKDKEWVTKNLRALAQINGPRLDSLTRLLEIDQQWTIGNFNIIKAMSAATLMALTHTLHDQPEWVTNHLKEIKAMEGNAFEKLVPLLNSHREWTLFRFDEIKTLQGEALEILLRLLEKEPDWTKENFPIIKKSLEDVRFFGLLNQNTEWATRNLAMIHQMSHMTSLMFWEYYENSKRDSEALNVFNPQELLDLQEASEDKELEARRFFLNLMDKRSNGFNTAANPFLREFQTSQEVLGDDEKILASNGASRSTLALHRKKQVVTDSLLVEKFKWNHRLLPEATFGVENEMYIPGVPRNSNEFNEKMNSLLGTKNYSYVDDQSLLPSYLASATEQVTSILSNSSDIHKLQSAMSIINDWGGFTTQSAGVHIHTGVRQWSAAHSLKAPLEKSGNSALSEWDVPNQNDYNITPFQLMLMKQFIINMASVQEEFYEVSRESKFNQRNAPIDPHELPAFFEKVSAAPDLASLIQVAQKNGRDSCVNLHSFARHGTIEIRGFTKKNSEDMGVDPNIPVRDIIFLQDVLIHTLKGLGEVLLSCPSPSQKYSIKPDEGLKNVIKDYTQDVFLLQIVHALGQREVEKRFRTMEAILRDKEKISSSTLEKIQENLRDLVGDDNDRMAQHFINVLHGKEQWNPFFNGLAPVRRKHSLRFATDTVLKGKTEVGE